MNITPLHSKLIVRMAWQEEKETVLASGLVVAGTREKKIRPDRGEVVAVGEAVKHLKVGDTAFFPRHAGSPVLKEDMQADKEPEFFFFDEQEIWGIIND